MADNNAVEDPSLRNIFLNGWKLFEDLEGTELPFASNAYQQKVKDAIQHFEQSTSIINTIGMFSANEILDEIPTEHLQYLLLPFFLGKLKMKTNDHDRGNILELSEIYFNDFLQRCADYGLCEFRATDESKTDQGPKDELLSLMRAAHSRNDKISQYRKKKELDEQIKLMRTAVQSESIDEDIKRDFFTKFLNRSIIEAHDELDSIKLEKQMVQMRQKGSALANEPKVSKVQEPPRPAMKPFIITRNEMQKAVFGLGYPSVPIMTVGEFYEQRVQEGIFPNDEQVKEMNKRQMLAHTTNAAEEEDDEKAANEALAENDDEEYLQRRRAMDEYKDVVRRGDGNRYNRS